MIQNDGNSQFDNEFFYQTGSTRPPKSRSGIVAAVLIGVILLGGTVSILGLLPLFQTEETDKEEGSSVSFFRQPEEGTTPTGSAPQAVNSDAQVSIQLQEVPLAVENIPQAGGLSLQAIYERNIASVVSISCTAPAGPSTGTGLVVSGDGYIVTNCHVIENATAVELLFQDGRQLPARVVGTDAVSDLAVLYVEATDLTPAQFGDSASVRVGDTVVAIGDPLGSQLRGTMTDGIISAINRDIPVSGRTMTLLQTNAALNAGNSGGPLINCYGQVIGINTMKIGDDLSGAGVEGLGFAIPSTTVKTVVDQLIGQGFVSGRPYLGFRTETVSSFVQMYYRLPRGVYITEVEPGSSAHAQNIAAGDMLLSLDGQAVTDTDMLEQLLYQYSAGDTVEAVIYRSGKQYAVELTLDQATG